MASSRTVFNGIFGSLAASSPAPGSGNGQAQHAFEQPWAATLPAHVYFIISAVFHYMGPAFAVLLFAHVDLLGVAWLRIASAALIFAVWRRPWRYAGTLNRQDKRTVLALGVVLAAMNVSFYLAINRVPLGTVAAIEFLGPISMAAAGARTRRNGIALVLAVLGVYFLTHLNFTGAPLGYLFAFANCAFFALYIVFGHRAAAEGGSAGIERLSAAMSIALLAVTPVGIGFIGAAMLNPKWLLAGVGVGVCSSVIPYVCDQFAMARLKRSTFALLLSILPATASVMGVLILRQLPSAQEIVGICLVMAGVGVRKDGVR